MVTNGTGWDQMPLRSALRRWARGTPPRWMPISATSLPASLRSAISWATRVSAR